MFYFGNYRPEVLLFCERPCLTAVDARRRTFVGWEETSVSQRLQLLTVSCGGTDNTEGAAEHMRTRGHANQRGTGALRGSGKWERWSEKKKQKKNGRRADCLDERHQSKLLSEHRRSEREGKKSHKKWDRVFVVFLPWWSVKAWVRSSCPGGGVSDTRRGPADLRGQDQVSRFASAFKKPPLVRPERADRARACRYRNTLGRRHKLYGERKLLKLPRLMRAERWHVELWLTAERGGVDIEGY